MRTREDSPMKLSTDTIEEVIRFHRLQRSRPTLPSVVPGPQDWGAELPPDSVLEDHLSRWLEAADALATHVDAAMLWSYAMRPWLELLLQLDDDAKAGQDTDPAFERLKNYWVEAARTR